MAIGNNMGKYIEDQSGPAGGRERASTDRVGATRCRGEAGTIASKGRGWTRGDRVSAKPMAGKEKSTILWILNPSSTVTEPPGSRLG